MRTGRGHAGLITRLMLGLAVVSASVSCGPHGAVHPWMNKSLSAEKRANLLLHAMTLNDKIALLHGTSYPTPIKAYAGYIPPNPRLNIPVLKLANGRAGVGDGAKDVTLLPAPIAAAASWDTALMNAFGRVLGEEEWGKGANVALSPTMDVVRVPEWGRTFETYGEDPYLNSQMAIAEIHGIQSQGPIANANMYLTMSQETNRFRQDSVVDERTLREIYLPPFQAAIERGQVGTVMCAYVKTNGVYSCENPQLLNGFLRKDFGFQGWVMSDWGATHSTVASTRAGLDQEMPSGRYYGQALVASVKSGETSEALLDEHVRRILITMFHHGLFDKQQPGNWSSNVRSAEHDQFSGKVAGQGTVLLKDERHVLPLSNASSIAVVGFDGGAKPQVEGGGSSHVVAPYVISPLEGIRRRAGAKVHVSYSDGSDVTQAVKIAKAARIAVVFASTKESEGSDRPNLELPGSQDHLISAVAAANPRTIVVLNTGGPVLMPWIRQVRAVIEAWYPGQEDGNAIASILFGDVDPSAKLPLTFPRTAPQIPTSTPRQWPGVDGRSIYSEKLQVGYRWFDAHHVEPLFPFGFGLSYTTFHLSHLTASPAVLNTTGGQLSQEIRLQVSVTNTGHRAGAEVVQAYVQQPVKNGEPPRQLRAFAKIVLNPGEAKSVSLVLAPRSFSIYDTANHRWTFPPGVYHVLVGDSSRHLPLHAEVKVAANPSSAMQAP